MNAVEEMRAVNTILAMVYNRLKDYGEMPVDRELDELSAEVDTAAEVVGQIGEML